MANIHQDVCSMPKWEKRKKIVYKWKKLGKREGKDSYGGGLPVCVHVCVSHECAHHALLCKFFLLQSYIYITGF